MSSLLTPTNVTIAAGAAAALYVAYQLTRDTKADPPPATPAAAAPELPPYTETARDSMFASGEDEGSIGDMIADAMEGMDRQTKRRFEALIGALVADAAALPTYWNYNPDTITQAMKASGAKHPEFLSPTSNLHFRIPVGSYSCHGSQILAIMESLVAAGGFDARIMAQSYDSAFGLSSDYGSLTNEKGQSKGWRNLSVSEYIKAASEGKAPLDRGHASDCQSDAYVKVIPIVCVYAGRPELMETCEAAIRLTQNNDKAVVMGCTAARILEGCILGISPDVSVLESTTHLPGYMQPAVREEFANIVCDIYCMRKEESVERVVEECGKGLEVKMRAMARSCMPPYCLQIPSYIVASDPCSYSAAVRTSILSGGDNCPRAALVGGCMGANMLGGGIGGDEGIPLSWIGRISNGKRVVDLARKVALLFQKLPPAETITPKGGGAGKFVGGVI